MFETLTDRFDAVFSKLKGRGRLTAADVDAAMRGIRIALLEADVNFDVVGSLTGRIRERAVGEELSGVLNPGQQVIKIVLSELTASLGGEPLKITHAPKPPTVVLMAGLQGTGKTTNSAKLARWFRHQGRNPMLVGADLQRPAAVEQLRMLGDRVGVPVFSEPTDPVRVASAARAKAVLSGCDVVIVDTAGRLAIDERMMDQMKRISAAVDPHLTFLVVDAMTGQDAATAARAFKQTLNLDGVILTKLDGDARGGAALSVKEVVGRPVAFASTGEKLADFELFHPDRMASRILGMGDMETLIEKAEAAFEAEEASQAAARIAEGAFTLDDFHSALQQVRKMGPLKNLIDMVPGMGRELSDVEINDGMMNRVTGMIHSMTPQERAAPDIIDASRRRRIASGAGCTSSDVKTLIVQFKQMRTMMKTMTGNGGDDRSGGTPRRLRRGRGRRPKRGRGPTGPHPYGGGNRGRSTRGPGGRRGRGRRGGGRVTPKGSPGGRRTPGRRTPMAGGLPLLPGSDDADPRHYGPRGF